MDILRVCRRSLYLEIWVMVTVRILSVFGVTDVLRSHRELLMVVRQLFRGDRGSLGFLSLYLKCMVVDGWAYLYFGDPEVRN